MDKDFITDLRANSRHGAAYIESNYGSVTIDGHWDEYRLHEVLDAYCTAATRTKENHMTVPTPPNIPFTYTDPTAKSVGDRAAAYEVALDLFAALLNTLDPEGHMITLNEAELNVRYIADWLLNEGDN